MKQLLKNYLSGISFKTIRRLINATGLTMVMLLIASCHSTKFDDLKPGETPDESSDIAGLWYQMEKAEEELKASPLLVKDKAINDYMNAMVCEIAGQYCKDIRVYIMDVPYLNAFMTPNGIMVIWTGLLVRATSRAQVEFIVAHEVGHFVRQHSAKQYRNAKNLSNLGFFTGMFTYGLSNLALYGVMTKYSRDAERDADLFAMETLKRHGLPTDAGAESFELSRKEQEAGDKDSVPVFFSTHPTSEERIEYISSFDGKPGFEVQIDDAYLQYISAYYDDWLEKEVDKRQYDTSLHFLNRLYNQNYNKGTVSYYIAEVYRKKGDDVSLNNAINYYNENISSDNVIPMAYKHQAQIYEKQNKVQLALKAYNQFILLTDDESQKKQVNNKIKFLEGKS